MTVLNNGNVGIGTTSPEKTFHVNGNSLFSSSGFTGLDMRSTRTLATDNIGGFRFYDYTNTKAGGLFGTVGGDIRFEAGGSGNYRMTILSGGNVGIGTTSPSARLTVQGAGTTTGVNFQTLNSAGTALVTGLDNGNVGLGTSPLEKLHIASGNIRVDDTTYASQYGVLYKGASRFLHNFNYGNNGTVTTAGQNTFLGINAGNFSMGSTATSTTHGSYNILRFRLRLRCAR